jgi:hypothetical protein
MKDRQEATHPGDIVKIGVTNMDLHKSKQFVQPTHTLFKLRAKKSSPLIGSFLCTNFTICAARIQIWPK